jgi:hypothetical protein
MDMVKTERIFKVHSGVRKRHTRLKRRKLPGRQDFVQRLVGGDVVVRRKRPATITESKLRDNLPEFKRAYEEARIEVRTPTGQLVDLDTLKVTEELPTPVAKPHPPMDSAANDKTFPAGRGHKMPVVEGGIPQGEDAPSPSVASLPGDEPEEIEDVPGKDPAAARKKERTKKKKKDK